MSMIYDNWRGLVAAVLKKEEIRQLCHQPSRSPSICSESSDFSASFRSSDVQLQERDSSVQEPVSRVVFLGGSSPDFLLKDIVKAFHKKLGDGTFWTSFLSELLQDVEVSDQEFLVSGTKVVIKLLSEVGVKVPEEEYKQQMKIFGNCRHENVAAPRAYYVSNKANGKLIVYDYHSQGSVSDMLRGKSRNANWETRLRIAIGAARGSWLSHEDEAIHVIHGGHGFEGDMDLETWFMKSLDCTSELFDRRLRRPIRNEKDVVEMVKTEIPGVDLEVKDSVTDWEALRAILLSHFRSMARVPADYLPAQDLAEMTEMMHVAMRCLKDGPKMTQVVLMLENIKASVSNRKPEHDRKEFNLSEKKWVWKRIF
ncbi:UNVERIFIED_CONTAM: putative inactive receptor kinase [Sesamum latifolium]|uniref:Inactive receptor kinase n=1 Tax=Sesamum latifolium TaxID=2727402 RepID=A0AAW2T838_9LAMI